jgi:outer membrane receptor for ferrienterochelin and colicin
MSRFLLKFLAWFGAFFLTCGFVQAQNGLRIQVQDLQSGKALAGVSLACSQPKFSAKSDSAGALILSDTIKGGLTLRFSKSGYYPKPYSLSLPLAQGSDLIIKLEKQIAKKEPPLVLHTSRFEQNLGESPQIAQVIGENNPAFRTLRPGDVQALFQDLGQVMVQTTNALTGQYDLRLQGLPSGSVQLLRDGLPMYQGFAGSLSTLQIAGPDLEQVEIIEGPASALYGNGALAGVVNFITKKPSDQSSIDLQANVNSTEGLDLSAYASKKLNDEVALTLLLARSSNGAFDADRDELSNIPRFSRLVLQPRFWFQFEEATKIQVGFNYLRESRLGGDMNFITRNSNFGFYRDHESSRFASQAQLDHRFSKNLSLRVANTINRFNRDISSLTYRFQGAQIASFSDVHLRYQASEKSTWIGGLNYANDHFEEAPTRSRTPQRFYKQRSLGLFVQNRWQADQKYLLESALRVELPGGSSALILPRLNGQYQLTDAWSAQIGMGMGYKTPSLFNEWSEARSFAGINPLGQDLKAERSLGANFALNFQDQVNLPLLGEVALNAQTNFFYTHINTPLILVPDTASRWTFRNLEGNVNSKGASLNLRLRYRSSWQLSLHYLFALAEETANQGQNHLPLTPQHRLNFTLQHDFSPRLWLGINGQYSRPQMLRDGERVPAFFLLNVMVEQKWSKFSTYLRLENVLNVKQSRFLPMYSGFISEPQFQDVFAPQNGLVVNLGVRKRLDW